MDIISFEVSSKFSCSIGGSFLKSFVIIGFPSSIYSFIKFLMVNVISSHEAISYFVIEIKFSSIKILLTKGKLNNLSASGESWHSSIELNSI